eukprot:3040338-Pyramimonas_sp.AAC.1
MFAGSGAGPPGLSLRNYCFPDSPPMSARRPSKRRTRFRRNHVGTCQPPARAFCTDAVSYTHLRAHETGAYL